MIERSGQIERDVLKKITPTQKERKELEQVIKELKLEVQKEINKNALPLTIELVGSTAKDTYLRHNLDIDLFLLFPRDTSRETLQENTYSIGRSILKKTEECFAEHPYIRGYFKGYKTEIVPCYRIESASQKLSAVDRTPLHTKYVKEYLLDSQKKEVRLLKQFLRGIGCYGAEAEVEGFSGYLCEILIMKYSSFQKLLMQSQYWQHGEKLFLKKEQLPDFDTPLVFIDPVDKERNVSSALSKEKFNLFIKASEEYVKNPRLTFFFPKRLQLWSIEEIRKAIGTRDYIGIKFEKPDIISENLYPQVRKAIRSIKELCERYDFVILDTGYYIDDKAIYIILCPGKQVLSEKIVHVGPPVKLRKNADEFIEKWTNDPRAINKPFEKDKRWYVEIKREYTDVKTLLKDQVRNLSLGKHIDIVVKKGFTILAKEELLTKKLRLFWSEHLEANMPWER